MGTMLCGAPIFDDGLATVECKAKEMVSRCDDAIIIDRVRSALTFQAPSRFFSPEGDCYPLMDQ
ncbi:hypothetical protein [Bradyrhizobium elkanii]|uniref:hypothetical protein n=1 Tax=Bradyrhizobium elkanii TaxID=29448 RepID=UPI000485E945|nr:hypothetical protein [Bradyrhizobium elkanii]